MSEPASTSTSQFILSPVGGAIIGALFYPTGCNEFVSLLTCAADQKTNALGWTMGGLVGNVDKVGAFFIGVVAALICYAALSSYESSKQRNQ